MNRCIHCHQSIHEGLEFCPHCVRPIHLSFEDNPETDDFAFGTPDNAFHRQLRAEQHEYHQRCITAFPGPTDSLGSFSPSPAGQGSLSDDFAFQSSTAVTTPVSAGSAFTGSNPPVSSSQKSTPAMAGHHSPGITTACTPSIHPASSPSHAQTAAIGASPAVVFTSTGNTDPPSWLREIHKFSPDMLPKNTSPSQARPSSHIVSPAPSPSSSSSSGTPVTIPGKSPFQDTLSVTTAPSAAKTQLPSPDMTFSGDVVNASFLGFAAHLSAPLLEDGFEKELFPVESFPPHSFSGTPSGSASYDNAVGEGKGDSDFGFKTAPDCHHVLPDIPPAVSSCPPRDITAGTSTPLRSESLASPSAPHSDKTVTETKRFSRSEKSHKSHIENSRVEKSVPSSPGEVINALLNITPEELPSPEFMGHSDPAFSTPSAIPSPHSSPASPAGEKPVSVKNTIRTESFHPEMEHFPMTEPSSPAVKQMPGAPEMVQTSSTSPSADILTLQRQNAQLQRHIERQEKVIWELRRQLQRISSSSALSAQQKGVENKVLSTFPKTTAREPVTSSPVDTLPVDTFPSDSVSPPIHPPSRGAASSPWVTLLQNRVQPFLSLRVLGGSGAFFAGILLLNSFFGSGSLERSSADEPSVPVSNAIRVSTPSHPVSGPPAPYLPGSVPGALSVASTDVPTVSSGEIHSSSPVSASHQYPVHPGTPGTSVTPVEGAPHPSVSMPFPGHPQSLPSQGTPISPSPTPPLSSAPPSAWTPPSQLPAGTPPGNPAGNPSNPQQ